MKTYILIIACLLLAVPCQAAKKHARSSQQNYQQTLNWRIQVQKNRLNGTDQLITREKQDIENWYANRLDALQREVKDHVLSRFRKADVADLYIWVEYFKMLNQVPYADGYFDFDFVQQKRIPISDSNSATTPFFRHSGSSPLYSQHKQRGNLRYNYLLETLTSFLMDKKMHKTLSYMTENGNQLLPHSSLRVNTHKIFGIMEEFQIRAEQLEKERETRLADLERKPQALKEEVSKIIDIIASQTDKPEFGMVSAISYEPGRTFALIEGIDSDLVTEGDMIGNIKIVKIDRYKVEFQKKREKWAQKIGETPDPEFWK